MTTLFRTLRNLSVKNPDVTQVEKDEDEEFILEKERELQNSVDPRMTYSFVLPSSRNSEKVLELYRCLKQWINECLAGQRIIVKDLQEDLFDGQVLQRLFEHLEGGKEKIDKPDIVCTKQGQLDKLNYVLKRIQDRCEGYHRELFGDDDEESIYTKNYFAICYLLVILTKFYDDKCNVRLPEKIEFKMVFLRKNPDGTITRQTRSEPMFTSVYENGYPTHRKNEDNFEKLYRDSREKFDKLKGTLVRYVANNLNCLGVEEEMLEDVGVAFRDGINLIMLIGQLDGYFVSQHSYNIPADTDDKRLQNVELALDLVVEAGCSTKVRARDIVSGDVKSIMRVIYSIFQKFSIRS
ncbi:Oidioi.mRNA.OKI2018_I69.chr2.g6987.t1.cds [Oikopleura dioica]|uniref:Oidioi.mRNA.OKI2018_I69.chr2.g6987.t1.cds n=1 Tax=Oikopleura dioica TaxID=34765 RepID=A0ABN7TBA9_OIKDI|nr:Oidioi.mRNA.OKI2018_I69.chr2.g6987.t1.cds [Oikopleura dioica]